MDRQTDGPTVESFHRTDRLELILNKQKQLAKGRRDSWRPPGKGSSVGHYVSFTK